MNIKIEQQYLLDLTAYCLFNVEFDKTKYDLQLDNKYIIKRIREQKLEGIIYHALKKLNINDEITNYLTTRYMATVITSTNQEIEYKKLAKLFDENNIDYVPLKGTFTKHYYPQPEMRLMGDIDVLIRYEKRDEVKALLLKNDYSNEEDNHLSSHHEIFNKGKFGHFEIHFRLLDEESNARDYLDEIVWDEVNGHQFNVEFNIVYQLAHYANHFTHGGASFKSMLDIGLTLQKEQYDVNKLKEMLIKTNYYGFFNHVTQIFNLLFKQNVLCFKQELDETEIKQITEFIFKCGDFGFGEENDFNRTRILNDLSKKKKVNFFTKLIYIISLVCIPYSQFKEISKAVKYCPILLPFGWIVRFFRYVFSHKGQVKAKLSSISSISKEEVKEYELVNKFLK